MRLGLSLGYWGAGADADALAVAQEADRLGFAVAWAAEAYGFDAATVLAFVAAKTQRIDIGSAVLQIPARTPAMTAMTAATLDSLSGGRFRLGLGVSGPQVSEGWHGVRFDAPLGRTREYVDIVRLALRRERVVYQGSHYTLPLPDGPGKALKLIVHPAREHIPIYLAAIGPRNLELAGEVADGWLAIFYSARHGEESLNRVRAGRTTAGKELSGFDVVAFMALSPGEDLAACADPLRARTALYLGGMGSKDSNFYNALAARMGFERAAREVQELYLARDYDGAARAVPYDFIDQTALLGDLPRLTERMVELAESGVTTLTVDPVGPDRATRVAALRTAAQALDRSGVAT